MGNELNLLDIIIVILKHKWKVLIHFILISIFAFTIAFILPKTYKSEIVFIPKGQSGSGLFSLIGNNLSADIIGGASLSKRQYKALLYSRELREKLIKKFDLIEVYEKTEAPNPTDQTLKILQSVIEIEEEEEGGLGITDIITITLTVYDEDPQRASDMANYLYTLLEEKAVALNKSEYEKITDFLIQKINQSNVTLESARKELNKFQVANHAYDIPRQVSMVLQAYSITKAEMLSLENKIIYLKSIHATDYDGIKILLQKKAAFKTKLRDLEFSKKKDVFMGLTKSLDLSNGYIDLFAEVETYAQLRLLLKQQLEQAKIKQSKNFSPLYLVDAARPAEYKCKPKRAFVILVIVFMYMSIYISIILLWHHYRETKRNNPEKIEKIDQLLNLLKFKNQ